MLFERRYRRRARDAYARRVAGGDARTVLADLVADADLQHAHAGGKRRGGRRTTTSSGAYISMGAGSRNRPDATVSEARAGELEDLVARILPHPPQGGVRRAAAVGAGIRADVATAGSRAARARQDHRRGHPADGRGAGDCRGPGRVRPARSNAGRGAARANLRPAEGHGTGRPRRGGEAAAGGGAAGVRSRYAAGRVARARLGPRIRPASW